jgi:hypothetical protein
VSSPGAADRAGLREFWTNPAITDPAMATASRQGFLSIILPFIEQANALAAANGGYNFRKDWSDPDNQPTSSLRIPTYECPSVPGTHQLATVPSGWTASPALGDYWPITRANQVSGVWTAMGATSYPGDENTRSMLTHNRKTRINQVPDGLSNTLMVGESGARNDGWYQGAVYSTTLSGIRGAWAAESNNIVCAGTIGPGNAAFVAGTPAKVSNASHVPGALAVNGWNQGELYAFHTGACNVVVGDGSVRSLNATISLFTLCKLASRADGLTVNPDE